MLHLKLRGQLSHIAEIIAVISDFPAKLFLVSSNETFLTKAVEQVKLEGLLVLTRPARRRGRGVLAVSDECFLEVTAVHIIE